MVEYTETKRLEGDPRAAEATLQAVEEATPYGIAVFDARGVKVWSNHAAAGQAEAGLAAGAVGLSDDEPVPISDEQGNPLRVADLPVRQVMRSGLPVEGKTVQVLVDGAIRWMQWNAVPIAPGGKPNGSVVVSVLDITDYKHAEQALLQQATHDALTGLPNRSWFEQKVRAVSGDEVQEHRLALLLLDIDRFRDVNHTLGHGNGDLLVRQFACRLAGVVGSAGLVARLGGDEFGVLLIDAIAAAAAAMARGILAMLDAPFDVGGQLIDVDASIGIALCPDHGHDTNSLLRQADIAMYAAKHAHEGFAFYAARLDSFSPDRLSLLGELRRSIDHGDLFLAYQPIVRIADRCLTGVEALVRWQHPVHGLILPDQFIGLAEGTGAIHPLTTWVLNEALGQCGRWRRAGRDLQISVNLSARNLHDDTLPSRVLDLLLKHQVPPDCLTLEITESAIMADPTSAMIVLTRLSNIGVRLAIDDFGTGYSSLAYAQRLPTQHIKIDKSFTFGLLDNTNDVAIVRAIIDLGHNLGRTIVAEGVEHKAVLDLLGEMHCDYAQGYYLSRPLPQPDIEAWIGAYNSTRAPWP